jgi:hypothetical protein
MHPYLPFAALPIAVWAAWFAATQTAAGDHGRYRVPSVTQIEAPSVSTDMRSQNFEKPDIRVAAFLPHLPPRPPEPTPDLVLQSVMTGSGVHLATINGQVVKQGDRVAGYRVRHIAADGVDLSLGSNTRRLPMRPLHELPPPVEPGIDPVQKNATNNNQANLTQDFWSTFNSSQP